MTTPVQWQLNGRASALAAGMIARATELGIVVHNVDGCCVIDCGVQTRGGLEAGILTARICMADLGLVALEPSILRDQPCPRVNVRADRPEVPCLWSQYAGWPVSVGKFFAMGSGPMRLVRGQERMLQIAQCEEKADKVIGVLETSKLPGPDVVAAMCADLNVPREKLTLLVARTASIAGGLQVVARSLETCMHKLHELGFPVGGVVAGLGSAFLPPVPGDDLTAIGRTNDSILYSSEVVLWVDVEEAIVAELGPKTPSCASADYGEPFAEIFGRFGGDFYKIDPLLFSPAAVTFNNLRNGSVVSFGKTNRELVARSFFGGSL